MPRFPRPVAVAYDSGGYGLADAEGIADGQNDIANFDFTGVGERQRREIGSFDL